MRRTAQSSYWVRSGPIPASATATATLTFAGNCCAASLTEPAYSRIGPPRLERSRPCALTKGACCSDAGGFRVCMTTDLTLPPSAAALTASSPQSAPVGIMILPPLAAAMSRKPGLTSICVTDITMSVLPEERVGLATSKNDAGGSPSTTTSACSQSCSTGRQGTTSGAPKRESFEAALAALLALTAASCIPGMPPASKTWATGRPTAPKPATATLRTMKLYFSSSEPRRARAVADELATWLATTRARCEIVQYCFDAELR